MSQSSNGDAASGGAPRHGKTTIRPPWFKPDAPLTGACDGCGRCISVCPESILRADQDGFPLVNFTRGGCSFCGACALVCPRDAFNSTDSKTWDLVAQIGDGCFDMQGVTCRICAAFCSAGAIQFRHFVGGYALPEVREDLCSGCGACVAPCPSGTVTMVSRQAGASESEED